MKYTQLLLFCRLLFAFLFVISGAFAQQEPEPSDDQYLQEIDKGVEMMSRGEFAKADAQFRSVLTQVEIVPADLCFYFGKNSYHLEKYKQSIDWLNKYIELKGTSGQFFDQAVEYLDLAKADFEAARNKKSKQEKTTAVSKSDTSGKEIIDCAKHPFVTCPICKGTGVIVQQGTLGSSVYKTCPYSDEHGRMTCEDYKLYAKGKLLTQEK